MVERAVMAQVRQIKMDVPEDKAQQSQLQAQQLSTVQVAAAVLGMELVARAELMRVLVEITQLHQDQERSALQILAAAEVVAVQEVQQALPVAWVLLLSPSISYLGSITIQIQHKLARYPQLHGRKVLLANRTRFKIQERLQNLDSHLPAGTR
jgi:hypothetical protein